jgi:uncharacterized protein YprB with RNaseH-like and TPR domain
MSSTRERLNRLFPPSKNDRTTSSEGLTKLEAELLGEESLSDLPLKERLERLVAATRNRPRRTETPPALEPEAQSLDGALGGEEIVNDHGAYYSVDRVFPLEHRHGRVALERLRTVPRQAFSVLSRGDGELEVDLERALFLDTETTGLAGGSGTCAFLVGLGFIEDDAFVVRQLFMRDHGEESAMLFALSELAARYELLVSYNGKTFDIPLLESRFVLARQRYSFEDKAHFDLLHPARSLWKARFESCRLSELEYLLLGLERERDVPGHLIPDIYFRYLRTEDASRLSYVFEHNCHDILSLAALTVAASEMLDEDNVPDDPLDDFSLGRLFERAAHPERSVRHYTRAIEAGVRGPARRRALKGLSDHHKRAGQWDEARRLWEELAAEDSLERIHALHELAMYHEHRERDFTSALERCETALEAIEESYEWPLAFRVRWRDAFEHRSQRLRRRSKPS